MKIVDPVSRNSSRTCALSAICLAFALTVSAQDKPNSPASPAPASAAPSNSASTAVPASFARVFDVVSIKPHPRGPGLSYGFGWKTAPEGFSATGINTAMLIVLAYGLHSPDEIVDLPAWATTDGQDIKAKTDEETAAALRKLPDPEVDRILQPMLQSMLADRFQFKIHRETRPLPVYDLVVAKGGPKLKLSSSNDRSGAAMSNGYISGNGVPISSLAFDLSNEIGRQVIDKTGLTGVYNYELKWTADEMRAAQDSSDSQDSGASVFAAIQEQLGLRLESAKGPVDVIVVDHVERPSEN